MFNKARLTTQNSYSKANFDEAVKFVVPSLYFEEDNSRGVKEIDVFDQIINSRFV